jgi:hypothetical protein
MIEYNSTIMDDIDLINKYNYDSFTPEKFGPWMRFEESPRVGVAAPDFSLWDLQGNQTSLSAIWSQNSFTVVEFGSFT